MITAPAPEESIAELLADIEQFGQQFVHEQDVFTIGARHLGDRVRFALPINSVGNVVEVYADFAVRRDGNHLVIEVTEDYGESRHTPPPLLVEAHTRIGLLPGMRLWAAAWMDRAARS